MCRLRSVVTSTLLSLAFAFPSYALGAGEPAPDFTLATYDGRSVSLADFAGKTVVLEWFSFTCPFVASHYREGDGHMQQLQSRLIEEGVAWLTINSNKTAPEKAEALTIAESWKVASTALLSDRDGEIGRLYGAKTTPEMFVIHDGAVVYHGAIDDEPGFLGLMTADRGETKNYVTEAVDAVLAGRTVAVADTKPYGCTVKY